MQLFAPLPFQCTEGGWARGRIPAPRLGVLALALTLAACGGDGGKPRKAAAHARCLRPKWAC
jgi:hypothetical protein